MPKVFELIGRSDESRHANELMQLVQAKGEIEYTELFRQLHRIYPTVEQFEAALRAGYKAGIIRQDMSADQKTIIVRKVQGI